MTDMNLDSGNLNQLEKVEYEIRINSQQIYLPNTRPKEKVDYLFIGTEPSLGRWAINKEDAKEKIRNGFTNYAFSMEDFILKYAIENYLSLSYLITDISKFAIKTRAFDKRGNWDTWLPVLKKEIKLFRYERTKIISLGKGKKQNDFLNGNDINVDNVLFHFSSQNSHRRADYAKAHEQQFKEFQCPSYEEIVNFAKKYLDRNSISQTMQDPFILKNLENTKKLSPSKKNLIFYFFNEFNAFKKEWAGV